MQGRQRRVEKPSPIHEKVINNKQTDEKCDSLFKRTLKLVFGILFIPIICYFVFSMSYDYWLKRYRENKYHEVNVPIQSYSSNNYPTVGKFEILDPEVEKLISPNTEAFVLGEGFKFVEGPVWNKYDSKGFLLFSDIPNNCIYRWSEETGFEVYKYESGTSKYNAYTRLEPGTNGLAINPITKELYMCQHGNRRIFKETLNFDSYGDIYKEEVVVDNYEQQELNSPNDLIFNKYGDLYFTDPPYGLPTQGDEDSLKQLPFNGVYRINKENNTLSLLYDSLTRPNGIVISPDGFTLYISVSDPNNKVWMKASLPDGRTPGSLTTFYNGNDLEGEGLPDGMTVDINGNIYASGPGGLHIFNPQGKRIGFLSLPNPPTNAAFGSIDEEGHAYLYITMKHKLLRIPTLTHGI
ncbi:hypothetical protein WA158_001380 [Blastocystis sp. Blastoise]